MSRSRESSRRVVGQVVEAGKLDWSRALSHGFATRAQAYRPSATVAFHLTPVRFVVREKNGKASLIWLDGRSLRGWNGWCSGARRALIPGLGRAAAPKNKFGHRGCSDDQVISGS